VQFSRGLGTTEAKGAKKATQVEGGYGLSAEDNRTPGPYRTETGVSWRQQPE
jgi:hypothetical protein